jgi:ribonuclease PH
MFTPFAGADDRKKTLMQKNASVVRNGRGPSDLRTVSIQRDVSPYAEGSALITTGQTRVLCTCTVEENVPDWRKGRGSGWLTAEYAMLPRSTERRTPRERTRLGGRTQEIQRLIGRALRAAVDLDRLGERTMLIDCDVIVADGGTRTAAITGAAVAAHDAGSWLVKQGRIAQHPMIELVAATSVGVIDGEARLDLEYIEDVAADVDMNLVALQSGRFVEVQGTGEHGSFSRDELDELLELGTRGIHQLLRIQRQTLGL